MTGWIVAGVVVAVLLVFLVFLVFVPTPSAPWNTTAPGFMDLKTPRMPLSTIVPMPTSPGNAADDYARAMTFYKQHKGDIDATGDAIDEKSSYNVATASADPWTYPNFKICKELADMVAAGTKKAEMHYTFVMTPQKLKPFFQLKYARDMYQISLGPFQCYQVHFDRKEYPQAEKRLQDMMILGWHMFNERCLPDMSMQGLDVMTYTSEYLERLYLAWPDAPKNKVRAVRDFRYQLGEIRENYSLKRKLLWDYLPLSIDPTKDEFRPGDVFNMAENEQDKAWKTQAILCLGPMKYRCVKRGDVSEIKSLIAKYLKSSDPLLKAAAECSNAMTIQQYRGLATDFSDEDE